ncbi:MAG: DUF2620 domain-containing protein [Coriobacteriia bacterium]|nr:DUF2620 domain-containing protein [Coriobacteriia bacterium]
MLKIVVGGQINKQEIHDYVEKYFNGEAEVDIKNDLDAVNAVKVGQYDYYVGACNTGGGGALAMAMALLGGDKCKTISMPGKIFPDDEIIAAVNEGKVAFGFTGQDYERVLPVLLGAIKEKN